MDLLNYVESTYIDPDYFVGSVDSGAIAFVATASIVAVGGKNIVGASLTMSSGTTNATPTRLRDPTLTPATITWDGSGTWDAWSATYWTPQAQPFVAQAVFTVSAVVSNVVPGAATFACATTVTVTSEVIKTSTASVTTVSSLAVAALSIQLATATVSAQMSVSALGTRIEGRRCDMTSTATMSVTAGRIRDVGLSPARIAWDEQNFSWDTWLGNNWEPTITGQHYAAWNTVLVAGIDTIAVAFSSAFSISAQPTRIQSTAQSDLVSQATFSSLAGYRRNGTAAITVTSQVSALGYGIVTADAVLSSAFDSYITIRIKGDQFAVAALATQATMNVQAVKSIQAQTALASTMSVQAQPVRTRSGTSGLSSAFSITAENTRLRTGVYTSAMLSSLSALARRNRTSTGLLSSTSSLNGLGYVIVLATADLAAISTLNAVAGLRRGGTANLSALAFELTLADIIAIDPDFRVRIDPESGIIQVLADHRMLTVHEETGLNIILPETRGLVVPQETRQETVL